MFLDAAFTRGAANQASSTFVPCQHLNPSNHQPTYGAATSTQLDRFAGPGQLRSCFAGETSALAQQDMNSANAGEQPMPMASGIRAFVIASTRPALTTAIRSRPILASWIGLVQRGVWSDPLVEAGHCCTFVGWIERDGSNMPRSSTTTTGTLRAYASRTVHPPVGRLWRLCPNRSQRPQAVRCLTKAMRFCNHHDQRFRSNSLKSRSDRGGYHTRSY